MERGASHISSKRGCESHILQGQPLVGSVGYVGRYTLKFGFGDVVVHGGAHLCLGIFLSFTFFVNWGGYLFVHHDGNKG